RLSSSPPSTYHPVLHSFPTRRSSDLRFDILGVTSGQTLVLFAAQAQRECVCYLLRNRILNSKNIREFFVERVRPQRRSICYVDQTSTHSDAIARFLYVTFQDRTNFQFASSGQRILIETTIFTDRVERANDDFPDVAQLGNKTIRHTHFEHLIPVLGHGDTLGEKDVAGI